jgi:ketosteroid isomerase-like protein
VSPQEQAGSFASALNRGELDAATQCFASHACLVTPDRTAVHGREQIRFLLAQLVARRVSVEVEASSVQFAGAMAMVSERWTIRSPGPAQSVHELRSHPLLALRRIVGEWKLVHAALWRQPGE